MMRSVWKRRGVQAVKSLLLEKGGSSDEALATRERVLSWSGWKEAMNSGI
jgi:hypothetical protein